MALFASRHPARRSIAGTVQHARKATRPVTRAIGSVTGRLGGRTSAMGHRTADAVETAVETVRAHPVATVVAFAALAVVVAGVASYLAYRARY
jgi:ElaB/YqjD/DUF883 family membrane-anchored ribosome-binding protein